MNNLILGILIGVVCSFAFVIATMSSFFQMWLDLNRDDLDMLGEIIKMMKFLVNYDKLEALDKAAAKVYSSRNAGNDQHGT